MLQDILPHVYHSEYRNKAPEDTDIMILQRGRKLLLASDGMLVKRYRWWLATDSC